MYQIKHINKFAKSLGKMVAKDAGFTQKELQSYINVTNIKYLIKSHCAIDPSGNLFIDEDQTSEVCNEIFGWLVGVDLAKLAAEDELDCYWDNKSNEMVFKKKEKKNGKKV
jgi:hypothetical protein